MEILFSHIWIRKLQIQLDDCIDSYYDECIILGWPCTYEIYVWYNSLVFPICI